MEKEYKNKARCTRCEIAVESRHRHDLKSCKCGAIFVDGGNVYWRWGEKSPGDLERILEERDD